MGDDKTFGRRSRDSILVVAVTRQTQCYLLSPPNAPGLVNKNEVHRGETELCLPHPKQEEDKWKVRDGET